MTAQEVAAFAPHDWIEAHLPHWLLKNVTTNIALWQLLALPLVVLVAYLVARPLSFVLRRILLRFTKLTASRLDDDLVECLSSPMTLLIGVLVAYELTLQLDLSSHAQAFVSQALEAAGLVSLFWGAWRSVEVLHRAALGSPWISTHGENRGILHLLVRFARFVVFATGVITVLQTLGYHVTALIAGLGIGGLAVALAAQKTLEHVLGSVMISLDRPFQVGDLIKIDDLTGEVESVGFRSTQLRTFDRTIVTIPNGRLADMRIENITIRDRVRLHAVVALSPGSGSAALMKFLQLLRSHIEHNDKVAPGWIVSLREVTPYALNIDVIASFKTTRNDEFVTFREHLLVDIMRIVDEAGAQWAQPTTAMLVR